MDKKIKANTLLKVLYLEDTPRDVEIIRELILDSGYNLEMGIAEVKEEYETFLRTRNYDIILSDFKLPGFDAFGALQLRNEICPSIPFICVSGSIGEETAIELLKLGADDYVLKDKLERFPFAIKRAIDDAKEKANRLKAEELLRESEMRFRQISESAHEWIWEVDKNGLYTFVSPVIKELLGYEAEELVGIKYFYDLFDPEIKEELKQAALAAFARKESFRNFVNCNIHKDGRKIILSTTGFPILDNENNLIGYRGADVDITERLLTEEKLQESEEKYRKLVELSPDAILIHVNGIIRFVNAASVKLFDAESIDDLIGKKVIDFVHPEYKKIVFQRITKVSDEEITVPTIEEKLITLKGRTFDAEVTAIPIKLLGQTGVQVVARDITERKQTEEAIIERENFLNTLLDAIPIPVFYKDKAGRYLGFNKAYETFFGASRNEIIGKTVFEISPLELAEIYNAKDIELLENQAVQCYEFQIKTKHGLIRNVIFNKAVFKDNSGKVNGLIGAILDITERKQAEEALQDSREDLHRMLNSMAEGAYGMDINGNCTFVNQAFLKILGYQNEYEVLGKHIHELIHHSHSDGSPYPSSECRIYRSFLTNQPINLSDEVFWRKDGVAIPVEYWSLPIVKNGVVIGSIATFIDITERKRAEETLRENELRFRSIWEKSTDGMRITNEEGIVVLVNDAYCKIVEKPREEIEGKPMSIVYEEAKQAEVLRKHQERFCFRSIPAYLERELVLWNGRRIFLELSNTFLENSHQPTLSLSVFKDITERKRAEETLRESEAKLDEAMKIARLGTWEYDVDREQFIFNDQFYSLLHTTAEREGGYTMSPMHYAQKFVHPDDFALVGVETQKALETTDPNYYSQLEHRIICADGETGYIHVNIKIAKDLQGRTVKTYGVNQDITERKRAEEKVQKLSLAVEQSPVSVVITNKDGEIEYVNERFYELTGFTKEEANGKNPRILKSGKHSKSFYEELWNTILSGKVWKGEIINKKKNGDIYWESESISPLVNGEGEITHFVAMKEDITEKITMISDLYAAKEKAEAANKLKDAFINNISHEIRTPLNGIVGLSSLIKESYSQYMVEDDESLFTGIDASAQRIIRTVDMILNYSRLQSGEFTVIPKQINLLEICELIIKQNKEAAEVKNLELLFDNRCEETKITGDEYTIKEVVSNLIDNAIKYTKKGKIEITLLPGTAGGVTFEIRDTGIGMTEEYLVHLFEPYRQEEMGYGRSYEGVGLGLALTKKFVELNNTVLSVESKKGVGTTFRIEFNKAKISQISEIDLVNKVEHVHPTITKKETVILVVEDDLINRNLLKRILNKNHKLCFADSAEEVHEVLEKNVIDLILMDISITGEKDGLELTKELKETKKYSNIPVIAVTAHAGNEDQRNALAAGCDEYLAKPFSISQLFEKIGKFV
ncbi:MAG: PAS domain S-box protein [Ignavibacteria bacterium]|nr:PAS domain S-box protein [Ignavibacteria bacterium]